MVNVILQLDKKLKAAVAQFAARIPSRAQTKEIPLRADLLSIEQLDQHARAIAEQHKVGIMSGRNRLLSRLGENEKILQAFNRLTLQVDQSRRITPAAEWLLDNFYLIEEQIQMARRHFPRNYSRELPRLTAGTSIRLPRVYDLVLELISHVDAQIDSEHLSAFVGAYQAVTPLNMGELWAIPIMLRLGLIENLRRITTRLDIDREDRDLADFWADRLQKSVDTDVSSIIVVVADMAKAKLPMTSAFVTEFCQRLSKMDPAVHIARNWIEQRLSEQGNSVEQFTLMEGQSQAADQVSISHTIASLRFLSATDWRDFVEALSVVDQTLRNDPSEVYRTMDFPTRDQYRHSVEQLARHSGLAENQVAWKAIELAEQSAKKSGREDREAHVGFYLIDKGQPQLEKATGVKWPWRTVFDALVRKFPMFFYAGGVLAIMAPIVFLLVQYVRTLNIHSWELVSFTLLLALGVSQLAITIVNWLATLLIMPRRLPRMDFSKGITESCRTMVVVPTMLTSPEAIEHLLETAEIHYLANRDKNVHVALLTDFRDADKEVMPGDDVLLDQISEGIDLLNQKYQSDRPNIFFLFHRPRQWNEGESVWMGYERKRGKLTQFNALLRGRGRERFSRIVGDISILPSVKYVITLDTDTQLPRDAARQLVGTMAHPLNRPRFDTNHDVVREGYSILQPRVGVSLPSASRSWFVRIFAGEAGIDPYTRAVSDVYQDIFGEGSFIGKGIYDVDAFEKAVHGRFPDNSILSHDLIESLHARSALISDVELYEEHPSRYNADINRRHRWIRGDWQIAQWLLPRVPGPDARNIANPLSGLSQWKIFDNLRRSLVPAALMLLLIESWILFPELKSLGSLVVLGIICIPTLLSTVRDASRKPTEWPLGLHLKSAGKAAARQLAQIFLTIAFLPYDAYISLDAIIRTWVRLLFTRKQLLEWQTASDAERNANTSLSGFYQTMWIVAAIAIAVAAGLILRVPSQLFYAAPFLFIWLTAPAIAWWISLPIARAIPELSKKQLAFLRSTARKTWRYFETFVTKEENWLPPDNFQEHPVRIIASRTSPTNMGLCLLANLTACDFGYISIAKLMERTRNTIGMMSRLEKYRGHFYNWYDTRTAKPMLPTYISTVDSGNLAGHLLVLGSGLIEYSENPIIGEQTFRGIRDTLGNLREKQRANPALEAMDQLWENIPSDLLAAYELLQKLAKQSSEIATTLADESDEVKWWASALRENCREHLDELLFLAPWTPVLAELVKKPEINNTLSKSHLKRHAKEGGITANGKTEATIPKTLREELHPLEKIPTLHELAELEEFFGDILSRLPELMPGDVQLDGHKAQFREMVGLVKEASQRAQQRSKELEALAEQVKEMANMDASFLFDPVRELFTIGYNVVERRRDAGFYDLLASEARLGSYVAIAQGQVPQKNWFSLGRLVAASRGDPVLVSWSGSMFEYLMPLLVMPTYENTLLDQTNRAAVQNQIEYGKTRGTPWGVSESGYNLTDAQMNYQYRAFGVPGLGFKRGLSEDLVIAPYASVMALMVAPKEACENMQRLAAEKRMGDFGFYEAIDYTPSRLPPNETSVTIRSFMVHHEGMSFLSLAYFLLDRPMQRRFLSYPPFKAEELLLQERVPKAITTLSSEDMEFAETRGLFTNGEGVMRVLTTPHTPTPEVHLLSNGRYHVMVSNSGGGYSRWQNLSVTRWREDSTRDCWGNFCYFRDVDSNEFWSSAYQPALQMGKGYEAIFTQARAEFRQRHGPFEVHTEIGVSPEDDVEMRRIKLTNHSNETRTIEVTTYAEVVLATSGADAAHPAFSNLFVQTEFVTQHPALLCTRRARSEGEKPPWMFHLLAIQGAEQGELSYETDRSKFIGRGRALAFPAALQTVSPLSNSIGSVLDPIVSMRRTLVIPPQETVHIEIVLGVTESREATLALVEKYHNQRMADRLFDLAWTNSQVMLRQLDATETEAQLYSRMAGALVYTNPLRRAHPGVLADNRRAQSGLWSYGISGDAPIVMLRISDSDKMDLVRQVVQAHAYWRLKGLPVELVIVNEDTSVYRQSLHDRIVSLIASGSEAQMMDRPGGIFVRRLEQIPAEDRTLLQSVARIILSDDKGTLTEQVERRGPVEVEAPELKPTRARSKEPTPELPKRNLIFFNGLGGFTSDGQEYVITLESDPNASVQKKNLSLMRFSPWQELRSRVDSDLALLSSGISRVTKLEGESGNNNTKSNPANINTPAPWVNVLANPRFGTVISESGNAYSWMDNSHEFRLTPWNNDPITDISGEAFYIRDDETGEFWSPTPQPARGTGPYIIRHGFGYSVFEHIENGISSEVWVYVAKDAPVKFTLLKLRNLSGRPRRLSVVGYWEWVLSDLRAKSSLHVQTKIDSQTNALLARNPFNGEFADRVAFVDVTDQRRTVTGDRREFFGRNGIPANPAALKKVRLSGKTGAGLDPCAAIQVQVDLPDDRERELSFRLGAGTNLQEAQELIQRFRSLQASKNALRDVRAYWTETLGAVQVETPNAAANILANGWLMYQTLSARLWGRTGFYQSGGAFGFRDQLQDAMAMIHAEPSLLREQLLRAAAHQFREGDVQHWWHPPSGRGVRTHFSDDYLWLPYAACRYINSLKDTGILDEKIAFLEGRALKQEEESYYDLPNHSQESGTFYEHCKRAIEYGLKFGVHGLPLIGCGDWNDGFNMIGEHGKGESVWLAFFLFEVLTQFADITRQRGDIEFAARCLSQAETLRNNIETHAWDGQWYCRAYFDNGEPLGSHTNMECQIDSLPQSWSVLTGATDPKRSRLAMRAVEQRLVRREAGLIQLFDPPFDKSPQNPGYIKGYVPGVRENGGQYTHGAIWTVMAFAQRGDFDLAWELFSLLNPINHGRTADQIATYKVEPYVVAADVYAVNPHVGRGGWTWYTGSAGWMYRLVIESLLGVTREGDTLRIQPRIPADWRTFKMNYRYRNTMYKIAVKQVNGLPRENIQVKVDGSLIEGITIALTDDRQEHQVEIQIGNKPSVEVQEAAIELAPVAK